MRLLVFWLLVVFVIIFMATKSFDGTKVALLASAFALLIVLSWRRLVTLKFLRGESLRRVADDRPLLSLKSWWYR